MTTPHQPRWDKAIRLGLLNATEVRLLVAGYAYRDVGDKDLLTQLQAGEELCVAADALSTDTPAATESAAGFGVWPNDAEEYAADSLHEVLEARR